MVTQPTLETHPSDSSHLKERNETFGRLPIVELLKNKKYFRLSLINSNYFDKILNIYTMYINYLLTIISNNSLENFHFYKLIE